MSIKGPVIQKECLALEYGTDN